MGAWGADTFENDDAVDFTYEVEKTNDLSAIRRALNDVIHNQDYLEAPSASAGLASADAIARLRGHFGQQDAYTATIDNWVRTRPAPVDEATLKKAKAVVRRVRTEPSELLELWSESDPCEWFAALDALNQRLALPAITGPAKKPWWKVW